METSAASERASSRSYPTRDELAELIGVSLTRHLSTSDFWEWAPMPAVRVRKLAAAVAADIEGKALHVASGKE